MATSILETVLKTAHDKAIPYDVAPEVKPEIPPEKKPETVAAKPPIVDKTADELKAAQAKVAELTAKLGETEKRVTDLSGLEKARDLWKQRKRVEAIEILSGLENSEEELDEFVAEYVKAPSKATASPIEAKLDQLLDKEAKRDAEAVKAKEAEAAGKEQAKKDAAEKARKDNIAYSASIIAKHADKFDLVARDGNKAEACEKAPIIALECLRRDKIDLEALTPEQAEKAMLEALTEIEADLEKQGIARFLKVPRPATAKPTAIVTTEKPAEPATRVPPPEIKISDSRKPASVADVVEKAKKRAIYQ